MASKHLKELLNEDQEPFILKNYIDDKLYQLKRSSSSPKTHLHLKKQKPVSENSSFTRSFCKNACFFSSSTSSPDIKSSPLFDFRSPLKSPCRNSNSSTLFVHIPARTASLLLEAALRIQKNSSLKKAKGRKSIGFGLFGSILKRITSRKRNQKNDCNGGEKRVSVKDIISWGSSEFYTEKGQKSEEQMMGLEDKMVSDVGVSCSCTSRLSSVWSESNEEKYFDLESSSSRSEDSEDMEFVENETPNPDFTSYEKAYCSSPFRFVLHNTSLSPCRRSPSQFDTFTSPKRSPSRNSRQAIDNENGSLNNYEEEEKEQNSPVSVLDPPFEDDDDQEDEEARSDCFDQQRNFANVQRTKQQLLHKLKRFERLAELDPIELEKRISEQEGEDSEFEEQYDDDDHGSYLSDAEKLDSVFVRELFTHSNMYNHQKIPSDMRRLVLDLVAEEGGEETDPCSREFIAEKVCKRLESPKEVDSNTIDMMVEFDFRRDTSEWLKNPEQMKETVVEIELAIFGFLVHELSHELVHCSSLYN